MNANAIAIPIFDSPEAEEGIVRRLSPLVVVIVVF
jgi:hypothetical protein